MSLLRVHFRMSSGSVSLLAFWLMLAAGVALADPKIAPEVQTALESLDDDEMLTVILTMGSHADLSKIQANSRQDLIRQVITILENQANATQLHLRALLDRKKGTGEVADYESFWVFNGLAVTARPSFIEELAGRSEIATITPNEIDVVEVAKPPNPAAPTTPEENLSVVGASVLWDLGYDGQDVVVAILDSGVDSTHPDLSTRWRGGNNSWFDPYGEHPDTPTDLTGHGTWTMGVMVGGDAGGTDIGVAPGAQWIAAKIFDDSGNATAAAIHACFQWLLDPDGNPGTPDTPHVVNNSWNSASAGCNLEFELDLQSLRAVGILPVFAAGNAGPGAETSRSPANNPSAFAVGNTTNSDVIYFESSRGPSSCGESAMIFPEMVAPGVDIKTTDLYGLYYTATGTSLAAPHVSGALALLLSAYPDPSALVQEDALLNGATDLGPVGPDNDYGYGRLDVPDSYWWLVENYTPPPTEPATLHVGDLDGSTDKIGKNWTATVTVTVHDGDEVPLADAPLSGTWSGGLDGTSSCVSDGNGRCSLSTGKINWKKTSVTFSVDDLSLAEYSYEPADNHDPDGSSDGSMITLSAP
jgi:subtilisin family serine protease